MTKSNLGHYSIYEEELEDLSYKPTSFFEKIIHKATRKIALTTDLKYSFTVPVSEFLRGELFCSDVSEAIDGHFTQLELIDILLSDFLFQAKRRSNPFDLYKELNTRVQQSIQIYDYHGEKEEFQISPNTRKMKEINCTIKRKEALRLEVMLSDIADLEPENLFFVKDVLQILYSDFIRKYKNGELTNVLENIIKRLSK